MKASPRVADITTKQLRVLLAVAQCGSISRAADRLRLSQSSLSRHVTLLEEALAATLFERFGRGVRLTEAGELLCSHARLILAQIDAARLEVIASVDEPAGEVRLAIPPSLRDQVTRPVVARFRQACPKVYLRLAEGTSQQSYERALRGDADVVVLTDMEPESELATTPLFREPLMLVSPVGSGYGSEAVVAVERLHRLPLIVTPRGNSLRRIIDGALHRKNVQPYLVLETSARDLLLALVRDGLGHTVLPLSGVRASLARGEIEAVPIDDLSIGWRVAMIRDRPHSAAMRRLVALLRDETRPLHAQVAE